MAAPLTFYVSGGVVHVDGLEISQTFSDAVDPPLQVGDTVIGFLVQEPGSVDLRVHHGSFGIYRVKGDELVAANPLVAKHRPEKLTSVAALRAEIGRLLGMSRARMGSSFFQLQPLRTCRRTSGGLDGVRGAQDDGSECVRSAEEAQSSSRTATSHGKRSPNALHDSVLRGISPDDATAELVVAGLGSNAATTAAFTKALFGEVGLTACMAALTTAGDRVNRGDLAKAEALLMVQASRCRAAGEHRQQPAAGQ